MSGSVNKVILIGNLGRDPETRRTQSGDAVVSFSLATTESWRDKQSGERRDRTEWHNVVIWNEAIGKIAESYLRKGSKVYLEGQLQTREFTDKDGNQRKTTEVVLQRFRGELTLLDSKRDDDGPRHDDRASDNRDRVRRESPQRPLGNEGGGFRGQRGPIDDDIPFAPEWR